jgi:hypothetical protein
MGMPIVPELSEGDAVSLKQDMETAYGIVIKTSAVGTVINSTLAYRGKSWWRTTAPHEYCYTIEFPLNADIACKLYVEGTSMLNRIDG